MRDVAAMAAVGGDEALAGGRPSAGLNVDAQQRAHGLSVPLDSVAGSQQTAAPGSAAQAQKRKRTEQMRAEQKRAKQAHQAAQEARREAKRIEQVEAKAAKARSATAAAQSARRMTWFETAKQLVYDDPRTNLIAFVECKGQPHLYCSGSWFDGNASEQKIGSLIQKLRGSKKSFSQLALQNARKQSARAAARRAAGGDGRMSATEAVHGCPRLSCCVC
jgi:hypothetical protein